MVRIFFNFKKFNTEYFFQTTYDVGVPQTYRGYAFPKDIHLSVAPGAPRSYSYPSPAPSVPCPQNLLLGCSPSVAAVPCKSVSYPGNLKTFRDLKELKKSFLFTNSSSTKLPCASSPIHRSSCSI